MTDAQFAVGDSYGRDFRNSVGQLLLNFTLARALTVTGIFRRRYDKMQP